MGRYTTLDGSVLDIGALTEPEREYFARCYAAYRAAVPWESFSRLVEGVENPLVRAASGVVTRAVYDHPLFRAVHDLEHRLGIKGGKIGALPGDEVERDPVDDAHAALAGAASRTSASGE